ncbi:MAG: cell division protein FtsZ, partial [Alphaproteobacteria bacterium]
MTINLSMPATHQLKPRITVVGVGGAGGNAVNNMITSHLEGVEFVVANTDAQALAQSLSERRIQLGVSITQGLGAGSQPDVGRAAAEEAIDEILENLDGSNMVFITAGMGGGTGTGGAPVVARAAREQGVLTVGVVTKPFQFEGVHRMRLAEEGLAELQQYVDTLIIIPNQNLFRVANEKTTFADAFKMADNVLYSGVRGVTDLMVMPGLINLDFADVRSVMAEMGKAMMGTGEADGENRAVIAAEAAISNPLLDDISMEGARGVLINITGGYDMTLFEVDEAANRIRDEVDPEANIIFGSTFDEALDGCMRVSVVSTGIEANGEAHPRPAVAVTEISSMPAIVAPEAQANEVMEEVPIEGESDFDHKAAAVIEAMEAPAGEAPVEPEPVMVDVAPVVPPVDELVRDLAAATATVMREP